MLESEKRGDRSYQVTDLSRIKELARASQRQIAADWMQRTFDLQRAASVGGANVAPSTLVRGLLTAIQWFQEAPMPTVCVATRREAFHEAVKMLDEAHVPIGQELREKLTRSASSSSSPSRPPSSPSRRGA
jgi:hypothetical protein